VISAHSAATWLALITLGVNAGAPLRADDKPLGNIKQLLPADRTVLLSRTIVRVVAEIELNPGSVESVKITPTLTVNGCKRPSPTFTLAPGASTSGSISWDICVQGETLIVQLALTGRGIDSGQLYHFEQRTHSYPIAKDYTYCRRKTTGSRVWHWARRTYLTIFRNLSRRGIALGRSCGCRCGSPGRKQSRRCLFTGNLRCNNV
jgi:hypothetical protein